MLFLKRGDCFVTITARLFSRVSRFVRLATHAPKTQLIVVCVVETIPVGNAATESNYSLRIVQRSVYVIIGSKER